YLVMVLGLAARAALALSIVAELDLPIPPGLQESAIGRVLGLSDTSEGSDVGRIEFAKYSWAQFLESPYFGNGYGWLRTAHVSVLAVLQSGGLLGFAAYLTWLSGILMACW